LKPTSIEFYSTEVDDVVSFDGIGKEFGELNGNEMCTDRTLRSTLYEISVPFLFLSFRRVVNVTYSFLGNSPASEI